MTLMEVDQAANIIRQSVNQDANIVFGSLLDDSLEGKLKISIFATGIEESGKKILYYSDNSASSDGNKINANEKVETDNNENQSSESIIENKPEITIDASLVQEGFELTHQETNQDTNSSEDLNENFNYDNVQEKKKTGFFAELSSLFSIQKKNETFNKNLKKHNRSKSKTDPNLFLFSDIVDNDKVLDNPDIVDLSQSMESNDLKEDLEVPSYLRKGNL